ncbi:hypothetical protein LSTR_LSTR004515 [Laodelphax striatellus]|uniref:Uncharacterized protein n=1 Tax=Laodelphax striatellus TaxID=195883 RepID=A0A482XH80_LAOST|nr:hypothetical protein LSTR_LSTR004515 [Laodelphax striatellus]
MAQEYKYDKNSFRSKAEEWTLKHATQTLSVSTVTPTCDNEKKSAKRKSSELESGDSDNAKKLKETD